MGFLITKISFHFAPGRKEGRRNERPGQAGGFEIVKTRSQIEICPKLLVFNPLMTGGCFKLKNVSKLVKLILR